MRRPARLLPSLVILMIAAGAGFPGFGQTLYFENPQVFIPSGIGSSSSAAGPSLIGLAWQEIKPRSATDRTSGDIYLSIAVSRDGVAWKQHPRFFGPIRYSGVAEGSEPQLYSMLIDGNDRILVAIAAADRETLILESVDEGVSFQQVRRILSPVSTALPSLFITHGGYLLLVSQGSSANAAAGSVSLAFSHSSDGRAWSELAPFIATSDGLKGPQLQPSLASYQGREYVVFESLTARTGSTFTWQLYLKTSADGGATWGKASPLSSVPDLFGADPLSFNNERPRIESMGTQLGLAWERSPFGADKPQIWMARLDAKGTISGTPEIVAPDAPARFAQIVSLHGLVYVVYADGSKGTSRIMLAQKGRVWDTQPLQNTDVLNAVFPHAIALKDSLYVFWENQASSGGTASLVQLVPLTSVGAPVVQPVDFQPGQPAGRSSITVRWSEPQPPDPAGIKEYQYAWTFNDGRTNVEKEKRTVSALVAGTQLFSTRKVDADGTWTFSIVAVDLAGNVTRSPATISFQRDATPPKPVSFELLASNGSVLLSAPSTLPDRRDANAYDVSTNTFTLKWLPAGDKDIVGYTYNMQPGWTNLAEYRNSKVALLAPPARVVTTSTEVPFSNSDNGVYVITVQAIDKAGNFSAPSTIALGLSNYLLVTRVDLVTSVRDPVLGTVKLTIIGRGFTENGVVRKIYLDGGHKNPPFDMEFDPLQPVSITDRQISGIVLDDNRQTGSYRIGLLQDRPAAGLVLYFTPRAMIDFVSPGTVKIGNFQLLVPRWIAGPSPQYAFSFDSLVVLLVVTLLVALSFLAIRKIVSLAHEGAVVNAEVMALLQGRPNRGWEERKQRMQALKRKGIGLRLKFTLLMVILVAMIVLSVSIALGYQMMSRNREALATGLQSNASILMDALAASAETQFRLGTAGYLGALDIPKLRTSMAEADYTTITGPGANSKSTDPKDYVWASDETRFASERTNATFRMAQETVDDELAKTVLPQLQKKIDTEGMTKFAPLVDQFRALRGQQANLLTKTDAASKALLAQLTAQLTKATADLDAAVKAQYAAMPLTLQPFNPNSRLRPTYLFYKPIIYYNRAENLADTTFFQGVVRLQVHTSTINQKIDDSFRAIFTIAGAIALAAIGLGILGAIIMASITVTPIRKLAKGVAVIRDTEDKEALSDHTIVVGTRDEIGLLADTVNEMTKGLVKAAIANKELQLGKDVQKKFLPLLDEGGRKGSTAEEEMDKVALYGYYEGAKAVSGDYFDFKRLDNSHYALIKCDVSGKSVSGALIMVEVATLFINYFRDWQKRRAAILQLKDAREKQRAMQELTRIDRLVYTINDMVEERGFEGKFAALTICIYNVDSGLATVCNAGDTLIHVYKAREKKIVHRNLPKAPAAGSFSSDLVMTTAPYTQVPVELDPGDVMFFFTDGFEESQRSLRNSAFEVVPCDEPGLNVDDWHLGTHQKGKDTEEFGSARMDGIINAVFNRERYRLERTHNPIPGEELIFDFSSCAGTHKETVLALASVEKVYRMVPDPTAGSENKVNVDVKIDGFLKEHFLQYAKYFSHRLGGQPESGYVTFTHAREDAQYDDLTILAMRRK